MTTTTAHPAAAAFDLIRATWPAAVAFEVTSSDQGRYGYYLGRVTLADGEVDPITAAPEVMDAVDDVLGDLDWGVFGDGNKDSIFNVSMTTQQIVRHTF